MVVESVAQKDVKCTKKNNILVVSDRLAPSLSDAPDCFAASKFAKKSHLVREGLLLIGKLQPVDY